MYLPDIKTAWSSFLIRGRTVFILLAMNKMNSNKWKFRASLSCQLKQITVSFYKLLQQHTRIGVCQKRVCVCGGGDELLMSETTEMSLVTQFRNKNIFWWPHIIGHGCFHFPMTWPLEMNWLDSAAILMETLLAIFFLTLILSTTNSKMVAF